MRFIDNQNSSFLTIVMPAYNEAESLKLFFEDFLDYCATFGWSVIIVDDGSTDQTLNLLNRLVVNKIHTTIIRHKVNRGYGAALKSGIAHVTTPYVITVDADGQHQPQDINALVEFQKSTEADMVIGCRTEEEDTSNRVRSIGKWFIRHFTKLLLPLPINDLNSGLKLYDSRLAKVYAPLCPDSMAFSDVIALLFIHQKHLVKELPIATQPRIAGESKVGFYTALKTILEIINITMLLNPFRVFVPSALLLITLGTAWGIPIILRGRGVSVGAMMCILIGINFFFAGLLAEQLALIRKMLISSAKED